MLQALFQRHKPGKICLQFSSGKDSAACLYLLKQYLPRMEGIVVAWVNPGNPYQETVDYMKGIAESVADFVEIKGEQPEFLASNGYPVEILPVNATSFGKEIFGETGPTFCSYLDCCQKNLWLPMQNFLEENEITAVIRGQKNSDQLRAPVKSGQIIQGIEYFFPLEDWNDNDVFDFLGDRVPASYKRGIESSLDCVNCTAYEAHNVSRLKDLRQTNPPVFLEVSQVRAALKKALLTQLAIMGKDDGSI